LFKLIRRLFLAAFILIVAFIAFALTSGGEKFRWFGTTVKDVSTDLGETADLLNQATQDIKSATNTIRKTGRKLHEIASETGEKASGVVNSTGEVVKKIKKTATKLGKDEYTTEDNTNADDRDKRAK
jgi:methyl-accepting chemotaxis protein